MMAFTAFHRTSSKLIPWLFAFHFGISTNIFHIILVGIMLFSHICCTNVTSFSQNSRWVGVVSLSKYAFLRNPLRCLAHKWVCPTALRILNLYTTACTSISVKLFSSIGKRSIWIGRGCTGWAATLAAKYLCNIQRPFWGPTWTDQAALSQSTGATDSGRRRTPLGIKDDSNHF